MLKHFLAPSMKCSPHPMFVVYYGEFFLLGLFVWLGGGGRAAEAWLAAVYTLNPERNTNLECPIFKKRSRMGACH